MTPKIVYFFQDIQARQLIPYSIRRKKPLPESKILNLLRYEIPKDSLLRFKIGISSDANFYKSSTNINNGSIKWFDTVYNVGQTKINDIDLFAFIPLPFIVDKLTLNQYQLACHDKVLNSDWKQVYPKTKHLGFYQKLINKIKIDEKLK